MKYDLQTANALTNNKNTSMDFKIGDAAVIIDILRNRLYSDKIRVVAQEYISNARDAMREAGNTKDRIEITLPTSKKPVLTIRDFGPGLSAERVGEVFVQFGKSTKRGSETQTGGFGLGGKSAFAYTDSFTVISIVDGTETHYVAHIGKNSVGSLDKVFEGKTKNKSGVEIQIGINKTKNDDDASDIDSFNSMVFRTIAFWNAEEMPVVTNDHDANQCEWYSLHSALQSGDGFRTDKVIVMPCADKNDRYGNTEIELVIDGIVYGLDDNHKSKQMESLQRVVKGGATTYLLVPAGLLEIAASREAIAVNQKNKEVLDSAMADAYTALSKKTQKLIGAVQTIDDAKECLSELSPITGSVRDVNKDVQGIKINFSSGTITQQGISGLNASGYRRKSFSESKAELDSFFILNDDELAESTLLTKVRELHKSQGHTNFGIIAKGLEKQAEILGAIPVSSLKAVRVYSEKNAVPEGKVNLRVFRGDRDVTEYDHVDTVDQDVIYVLVENVETRETLMQYRALQTLLDEYCSASVKIAFPSRAALKQVTGKDGFVSKDEFFANVQKHLGDKAFTGLVESLKTLHAETLRSEFETLWTVATSGKGIVDEKFMKHAKVLSAIKIPKAKDDDRNERQAHSALTKDALVKTVFDKALGDAADMPEFVEYVNKTYPLLKDMHLYSRADKTEIVHYLNGKYASIKNKAA